MRGGSEGAIDYLIGGLRISLADDSDTPGPRSHVLNVVDAMRRAGRFVTVFQANHAPGLSGLSRAPEGGGGSKSLVKRVLIDVVRLSAACWSGVWLRMKTRNSAATLIYERASVMQNMTWFHANKFRATTVVESNGIMSIETAVDRNASAFQSLARAIERRLYRDADLIVAVSQPLADAICSFADLDGQKIVVVPNAVPRDLAETPVHRSEVFRVGFMGAIVPWQRIEVLLKGAALSTTLPRLEVRIVGHGQSADELRSVAAALGIESAVTFLGKLKRQDSIAELSTWAVGYAGHVATSHEQMYHSPLKIYEYAALGLHVIATDYSDARSLQIDGAVVTIIDSEKDVARAIDAAYKQWEVGALPSASSAAQVRQNNTWDARVEHVMRRVNQLAQAEVVSR